MHRFGRVHHEVQQDLLQLASIGQQMWNSRMQGG
jgi:hypothetical protein